MESTTLKRYIRGYLFEKVIMESTDLKGYSIVEGNALNDYSRGYCLEGLESRVLP